MGIGAEEVVFEDRDDVAEEEGERLEEGSYLRLIDLVSLDSRLKSNKEEEKEEEERHRIRERIESSCDHMFRGFRCRVLGSGFGDWDLGVRC